MPNETPIDLAFAAMGAAQNDEAARLVYFERLADAELFLLLEEEAEGERIKPEVFETPAGQFLLVFDREERLSAFTGKPAPFVALSGRVIANLIQGQDIGLGVNLGVEGGENLITPDMLDWLLQTLEHAPEEAAELPVEVARPKALPDALLNALDRKLPTAVGLASKAFLAEVTYKSGRRGHLLAYLDAKLGAQEALAKATNEALVFSGIDAGELDVVFLRSDDPIAERLARVALVFDLPEPAAAPEPAAPKAPGTDPNSPPILR